MCLMSVDREVAPCRTARGFGYTVKRWVSPDTCQAIHYSRTGGGARRSWPYHLGRTYRARASEVGLPGYNPGSYTSGFHLWTTVEAARSWRIMPGDAVYKVAWKGLIVEGIQDHSTVLVVREITLLKRVGAVKREDPCD